MDKKELDDFLFNLSCMEDYQMKKTDEWIYYINIPMLKDDGDNTIWRVRQDGSCDEKLQKSTVSVKAIIGISDKWIYFLCDSAGMNFISRAAKGIGDYRKMTIRGSMEQDMSKEDEAYWETEMEEIEEM